MLGSESTIPNFRMLKLNNLLTALPTQCVIGRERMVRSEPIGTRKSTCS